MWRYAGMTMQLLAGIGLFLFLGLKTDEWLKLKTPTAVWVLPLLFILAVIIRIVRDTGKKTNCMFENSKPFRPLIFLFVFINALLLLFMNFLLKKETDPYLILGANLFFLALSLFSMRLQMNAMKNPNPNVFVRSVMSSMLIKMVVCIAAVITYVYANGGQYNKKGIFISLVLYLFYLAVEVYSMMKLNRKKNA